MQKASPSPYEFLLQFGEEQLVGASPEMFVRVEGRRIESSPISGTAQRTGDPMRDADAIKELLKSAKEESELTMCTDVDRNDKSRVCEPGSVQVIGRRLIESYAGVFHTTDYVQGTLKEGFDSLDAFLTHMWSVTMIGAPKKAAAVAIEALEKSARGWYGGAVGMISLNGDINTGILIRTTYLRDGMAEYPVGATLLYDSVPALEERETRFKATAFFRAMGVKEPKLAAAEVHALGTGPGKGARLLLVDNDDCFIHTLANYAQQTGAEVVTYRSGFPPELIAQVAPTLILISPGPGRPRDFGVPDVVHMAVRLGVPVFGVCLGLQGIVEAFGGELGVLDYPMHGKPSKVRHRGVGVFEGLPEEFLVGRYHSLYARRETFPACLEVTAETEDGVIMGVRHRELPSKPCNPSRIDPVGRRWTRVEADGERGADWESRGGVIKARDLSAFYARVFAASSAGRRAMMKYRPFICPFEDLGPYPEGASVLDIGCGCGLFLPALAFAGKRIAGVGVDAAPDAIRAATLAARTAEIAKADSALSFESAARMEAWPAGEFDVVSLIDVLHHIPAAQQRAFVTAAVAR